MCQNSQWPQVLSMLAPALFVWCSRWTLCCNPVIGLNGNWDLQFVTPVLLDREKSENTQKYTHHLWIEWVNPRLIFGTWHCFVSEKSEIKKFLRRKMFIWFVYSSGWMDGYYGPPLPTHPIFHVYILCSIHPVVGAGLHIYHLVDPFPHHPIFHIYCITYYLSRK